ncbi:hypothetical protein Leryth_007102 [Lithospermum erythrorhizon]|nr:hypothetical protein Leryth_007102 [Lithospermum erythrorhizon]
MRAIVLQISDDRILSDYNNILECDIIETFGVLIGESKCACDPSSNRSGTGDGRIINNNTADRRRFACKRNQRRLQMIPCPGLEMMEDMLMLVVPGPKEMQSSPVAMRTLLTWKCWSMKCAFHQCWGYLQEHQLRYH